MRVERLTATAGPDGAVRLTVPAGPPGVRYEVAVVLSPLPAADGAVAARTPEELGWPPGYFERTAGSIQDPAFDRGDQGEYEIRETFG